MKTRLLELLADKAAGQLDPADIPELGRLLDQHPDVDPHQFDQIVDDLRIALDSTPGRARLPRLFHRLGWLEWTAAAVVVLAAAVAVQILTQPTAQQRLATAREELRRSDPSALILPWVGIDGADRPPIPGDVVWSDRLDRGYLRFEGLAENKPQRVRYSLKVRTASGSLVTIHTFDAKKRPGDWIVEFETDVEPVAFQVTLDSIDPAAAMHRTVASTGP